MIRAIGMALGIILGTLAVATLLRVAAVRLRVAHGTPISLDSLKFAEEPIDAWSPIMYGEDTIGKLVSVARITYRAGKPDSLLFYRGVLTGRPPAYQPDSLAAIDSSDDGRFAHQLRLIPLHSLSSGRAHLGTLRLEPADVGITVMAALRGPSS